MITSGTREDTVVKILVIEDENIVAAALKKGLESESFEVEVALTGEDGFFRLCSKTFDLVILDLMLPGRDGMEILRALRKTHDRVPVLILTARDAVEAPVGADLLLTLAVDEEPLRNSLRTLIIILMLGLPVALGLAALGGFVMTGRLLHPVAVITDRAARITADSLSARLPVENPGDEFGRLAGVINVTLSRLEDAFDRLRRFTADASHELRKPLTVIRSVGEVALQEDLDAAAYRDRIGSMLEEVERLTRLVDSLLTLTRADSGPAALARREIDVTPVIRQAVEDMRVLAEEKEQTLVYGAEGPAICRVDEATLRLALVNLLDNAIKYRDRSGAVTVKSGRSGNACDIEIGDTGPGIASEHEARVFDRFYRVEKDRSGPAGGAGLGLSIAKWAVEANGGRIELDSREGRGSVFRIVLPASDEDT